MSMIRLRLALFFVIGLLLGSFAVASFADSIAPSTGMYTPLSWKWGQDVIVTPYSNADQACQSFVPGMSSGFAFDHSVVVYPWFARCYYSYQGVPRGDPDRTAQAVGVCNPGDSYQSYPHQCQGTYCPSGYTLSSDKLTCEKPDCKAGQTWNGSHCICDNGAQTGTDGTCCPVAGSGGGAPMQWCYVDNAYASSCDSAGTNGCKVRCNNVTFQKGPSGDSVQIYPKQALGQNCSYTGTRATSNQGGGPLNNDELKQVSDATKDPGKAKTPEGCLAAGMGYVTGSSGTTCVSGGDTGVTDKKTSEKTSSDGSSETTTKTSEQTPTGGAEETTTTKTNPDGSTTTTTTKTTCKDDGTCETTTTETTKDASGNPTGNKNTTEKNPLDEFCTKNPDSELCKGTKDTCKDHPERVGCMEAGEAPEEGGLPESSVGPSIITPVSVGGSGTCPQGPQLPYGMGNMSFDGICQLATGIRPIVLAMAWLSAGLILLGGFKEG